MSNSNTDVVKSFLSEVPQTATEIAGKANLAVIRVNMAMKSLKDSGQAFEQVVEKKKVFTNVQLGEAPAPPAAEPKDYTTVKPASKDKDKSTESDPESKPKSKAEVKKKPDPKPETKTKTKAKSEPDKPAAKPKDVEPTAKFESIEELLEGIDKAKKPVKVGDSDLALLIAAEYDPVELANQKGEKANSLVRAEAVPPGHRPILLRKRDSMLLPYKDSVDIDAEEYVLYVRKRTDKPVAGKIYVHTKNYNRIFDKYHFNGETMRKGKLVLCLVKKYMAENPKVTAKELQVAFPDSLVKTFGLITTYAIAKKAELGGKQRYFGVQAPGHPWGRKQDQIKLHDGSVWCVTNQIDKHNFVNIVNTFIGHGTIKSWEDITLKDE